MKAKIAKLLTMFQHRIIYSLHHSYGLTYVEAYDLWYNAVFKGVTPDVRMLEIAVFAIMELEGV